jgi:hypothetical protein
VVFDHLPYFIKRFLLSYYHSYSTPSSVNGSSAKSIVRRPVSQFPRIVFFSEVQTIWEMVPLQ